VVFQHQVFIAQESKFIGNIISALLSDPDVNIYRYSLGM